ncbi:hypothetical protein SteCoe_38355 [Stentor coeruleus]|uniref:EF-hand domain-containing protein n=1 Tax=Stentor coeruleus TaxID=5963 RepID=A0A1R2ALI6_9CILI|nr:hypothetical protein SteCoe_38355 [Stentor coeruleus]
MDYKAYSRSRSLAYLVAQAKIFEEIEPIRDLFPMPRTRLLRSLSKTKLSYKEISNKLRLETRRRLVKKSKEEFTESEIRTIFNLFDSGSNGYLASEDIFNILRGDQSMDEIKKTFDILDEDADGKLSFEEFYLIMNS